MDEGENARGLSPLVGCHATFPMIMGEVVVLSASVEGAMVSFEWGVADAVVEQGHGSRR